MSMNLKGRNIEFIVKAGARSNVVINITDASGVAKNLSDTSTYATAKWKVWQPDGTILINGDATYSNRSTGEISYILSATDTVIANAGIWEGEIELLNTSGISWSDGHTCTPIEAKN